MLWLVMLHTALLNETVLAGDMVVGDDQLQIVVSCGNNGLQEKEFRIRGVKIGGLSGSPWILNTDKRILSPEGTVQTAQFLPDKAYHSFSFV
jgi:hypothetical protein